jgi:hypothetical protein
MGFRLDETAKLHSTVLRQLWRLMELNADIDRNQSDGAFAARGGTIRYIFDENVFELFVRPFMRADYVEAFHNPPTKHDRLYSKDVARAVTAQSALICGEYLFSGRLPGQRDRSIYMTEWHFWELHDQLAQRRQELEVQMTEAQEKRPLDDFLKNIEEIAALRADKAPTSLDRLLQQVDPLTAVDASELRKRGSSEEVLRRFVVAREAARMLAEDQLMGPLEQLDRIFSREIAPNIRPLHLDFRPDAAARESLPADARAWFDRLLKEQDIRKRWRQTETHPDRPRASLQSDARAVAYILWAVGVFAKPGERFVFVTGDRLLFDAYRRWHVEQQPGEPFVLRRLLQFAPLINLNDTPNDISDARALFDRTRRAIEVPLIVFNLATSRRKIEDCGIVAG